MAHIKNQNIENINWTGNENKLIWALLTELVKTSNHRALYGVQKENKTLGTSKTKIHKEIALVLFPDIYTRNKDTLASHVKSKIKDLYTRYKKEAKRLTMTGGGLGGNDEDPSQSQSQEEHLDCYIPAKGPDGTTMQKAKNLWEEIHQSFMFFGAMHQYLSTRPNTTPPVVSTGVGPNGRQIIHLQAIENAAVCAPSLEQNLPTPTLHSTPVIYPALAAAPVTVSTKENSTTQSSASGKRTAKESSFTVTTVLIDKAKGLIQRVPKKTFEERLADATEASVKSADTREAVKLKFEKKRLQLEALAHVDKKRDQLIKLIQMKVYTGSDAKRRLADLDKQERDMQGSSKCARP